MYNNYKVGFNSSESSRERVWDVSWVGVYGGKQHKIFVNKQSALIYVDKLKNGQNEFVTIERRTV